MISPCGPDGDLVHHGLLLNALARLLHQLQQAPDAWARKTNEIVDVLQRIARASEGLDGLLGALARAAAAGVELCLGTEHFELAPCAR